VSRSRPILYAFAAFFAVVAVVDLIVRPMHYQRSLALSLLLAVVLSAMGVVRGGRPAG
jgi:predicted PurR-regulated permease PerM